MNEGFNTALQRRSLDTGAKPQEAANSVAVSRFGLASPDFFQATLIIDRLRHHNLALERLLSGLDRDLRTHVQQSNDSGRV